MRSHLFPKFFLLIALLLPILTFSQTNNFVVHEWGTFTSVAAKNGQAQDWRPLNWSNDLPSFVYQLPKLDGCKICTWAKVRMETPVLYFYADREITVNVQVDFPAGKITEWFPLARVGNTSITWSNVVINPKSEICYPQEARQSHYYPARETDAAPLAVGNSEKMEYEKFLFYRGTGNFDLPLTVQLSGNQVKINSALPKELGTIFLFENKAGKIGFQPIKLVDSNSVVERPALTQSVDLVISALEKSLTAQGLYAKEAQAMLTTWQDSWFEEGLRIFYLTPSSATEQILPFTITPQPEKVVRVLVGRIEILTPEFIQKIEDLAARLLDDPTAANEIRRHGRFADGIIQEKISQTRDERLKARLQGLRLMFEKEY